MTTRRWRTMGGLTAALTVLVMAIPLTASAEWEIENVDSDGSVGKYSSLELDALGSPHISYI